MTTPITITIFVRHTPAAPGKPGCKYAGDEFAKRCNCRKHLRWTANGEQHRRTAGTRSWTEAERIKRDLEDQLSGRAVAAQTPRAPSPMPSQYSSETRPSRASQRTC